MAKAYLRGGRWWIDYSINGRRYRRPTGIPAREKRMAVAYSHQLDAQIARGHIGWETRGPLINRAIAAWLETIRAARSFQTHRRYRHHLKHFSEYLAASQPGMRYLSEISPRVVQEYIAHRSGHPTTIRAAAALLFSWFSWCVDMRLIAANPASKIVRPRPVASEVHYFSPDEMRSLLDKAGPRRPFYEFLYRSLARFGEAVAFRRKQVDFDRKVLIFPAETSKSRRRDEVELSEKLAAVLEPICRPLGPEDLLFPHEAGVHRNTLLYEFQRILKSLGLRGNLHSIRHTGISHLVMPPDPVPLAIVKELARHRDIKTTLKYAHLSPETRRGGFINLVPV